MPFSKLIVQFNDMTNLHHFKAKICYTACGHLIVDGKILLIKHKKAGSWMSPGGHIDENELPHQAAEREFFEETGVQVKTIVTNSETFARYDTELLPQPLLTNLHWVSKENYHNRIDNKELKIKNSNNLWKKGCEQHLGFVYLMEPIGSLDFCQNIEETDGIAWFSEDDIDTLEMLENIKQEIHLAFGWQ